MATLNHSVHIVCGNCRVKYRVMMNGYHYERWLNGELIQRALPYLSPDERELLMSHICGPCYDKAFGGDDE